MSFWASFAVAAPPPKLAVVAATVAPPSAAAPHEGTCIVCATPAYAMDKVVADGRTFHKWCMRCTDGNCKLSLGNYTSAPSTGQLFCKPHFKQRFKEKGNYDTGFGSTQRKHDFGAL